MADEQNLGGQTPAQANLAGQQQGGGNSTGYSFGDLSDKIFVENPPKIPIPEHPNTQFDETLFLKCILRSISLLKEEKLKIIESVPKLSQYQIDELIKILEEEKRKFQELCAEHGDQLKLLEERHLAEASWIEDFFYEEEAEDNASTAVDEIKKNLGLNP